MTPDEFRKIRKAARMTQAQMAEHLGKSRLTINNWETGKYAIPVDVLGILAERGVSPEPKETAKQERDRLAYERHLIDHWRGIYRATRAWPQYNNHAKAMALFASQGHVIPPCAYAALVADFPDILSDPHGDHAMTREQSAAALNLKQS